MLKQGESYKLLINGVKSDSCKIDYFDGYGNAVVIMGRKPYQFDPNTGECLNYSKFRLEL